MADLSIVYLALDMSWDCHRGIVRGIKEFTDRDKRWMLELCTRDEHRFELGHRYRVGGFIGAFTERSLAAARKFDRPIVRIDDSPADDHPRVREDNRKIGMVAADHLVQNAYKNFAYVGIRQWFSLEREEGFISRLAEHGRTPHVLRVQEEDEKTEIDYRDEFREWIRRLPKPVGLLGCNDWKAWEMLWACRMAGLRVPEDVAILGVDDDEVCENLGSISSVAVPWERVGFEAAMQLERMMDGREPTAPLIEIPPIGVIQRYSTDFLAVDDEDLKAAMAYIHKNAEIPFAIDSLLRAVSVSRRSLEYKFKARLGRTILDEIHRARVERAKQFLSRTDLPLRVVATRSGFTNLNRLILVFKDHTGLTPSSFRVGYRPTRESSAKLAAIT